MQEYKQQFIDLLLEAQVLSFGDFTTKSGRKTPYFINTARFFTGRHLSALAGLYARGVHEHFSPEVNLLFGPAYKGITLSALCAAALHQQYDRQLSYCYNRKEIKDHGEGGYFVGKSIEATDRIVIVEDVITAGTAIRQVMPALLAAGPAEVEGVLVSVDRQERGSTDRSALQEISLQYNCKVTALVTIDEIVSYLSSEAVDPSRRLTEPMLQRIAQYRSEYGA